MKVVFFHDAPLVKMNDGNIYSIGFSYSVWERYLTVFNSIEVVTRMKDGSLLDENMKRGLKKSSGYNVDFSPLTKYTGLKSIISNWRHINIQIKNSLDKVDCAVIRLPSVIGILACYQATKMKKPFAIEVVGCSRDSLWYQGSFLGKISAFPMYMLNKYYIGRSKYNIYVTENFLQNRYPSYGHKAVASNVEITEPVDKVLTNRLLRIDKMNSKEINIGMIGSLDVAYKGHETTFRALSQIKEDLNFQLFLLGGGDSAHLKMLAKDLGIIDKIVFCGTLPSGNSVMNWLDNIDLLLIPSLTEGLPRALIEAMSRGCPAIGSEVGGIPELISNDLLIQKKDFQELAQRIIVVVGNKDRMREIAIENFQRSKEFDVSILNKKRKDFLLEFKNSVIR